MPFAVSGAFSGRYTVPTALVVASVPAVVPKTDTTSAGFCTRTVCWADVAAMSVVPT